MPSVVLESRPTRIATFRGVGVAMLIAASVLWSLSGVAVKLAKMDPLAFAFYRSLAAAVPMIGLAFFSAGRRPSTRWMLLGVPFHAIVVSTLVATMTLSTAAAGILLQYTAPVFCAVLAWLFQRRAIDRRTAAALVIASLGIALMVAARPPTQSFLGPTLGIISGIMFAALILTLEKIDRVSDGQVNPFLIVLYNNAGTVLLLLPICLAKGVLFAQPWQLALVGVTGIVQLAFPYVLFQLGLRRVHPVDASLLILLEPVLNPVWVAIFVGEIPDRATIFGGLTILTALVIEATKPQPRAQTPYATPSKPLQDRAATPFQLSAAAE